MRSLILPFIMGTATFAIHAVNGAALPVQCKVPFSPSQSVSVSDRVHMAAIERSENIAGPLVSSKAGGRCIWTTEGRVCPEDMGRKACWEGVADGDGGCDADKGTELGERDVSADSAGSDITKRAWENLEKYDEKTKMLALLLYGKACKQYTFELPGYKYYHPVICDTSSEFCFSLLLEVDVGYVG
ncbi:MAG: hypothetical protein Q9183_003149 [Haloplaca sp. 2 TL-2023]